MSGCLDIALHTYVHTYRGQLIGLPAARPTEGDRERDRKTERDGPEYKGPPDAITKPSDQKSEVQD